MIKKEIIVYKIQFLINLINLYIINNMSIIFEIKIINLEITSDNHEIYAPPIPTNKK